MLTSVERKVRVIAESDDGRVGRNVGSDDGPKVSVLKSLTSTSIPGRHNFEAQLLAIETQQHTHSTNICSVI
jgi:hypothetical protein